MKSTFSIKCRGWDVNGCPALKKPVKAKVVVSQRPGSNDIGINVECPHCVGPHGDRCDAAGYKAFCPYSVDLPMDVT